MTGSTKTGHVGINIKALKIELVKKLCFAALILILYSCGNRTNDEFYSICYLGDRFVKVYHLNINNPSAMTKIDKKFVEIEGYYFWGFEESAIYPSKNISDFGKGIWVGSVFPVKMMEDSLFDSALKHVNGKKISLIGRLDLSFKGHLAGYLGSVDSVVFIRRD